MRMALSPLTFQEQIRSLLGSIDEGVRKSYNIYSNGLEDNPEVEAETELEQGPERDIHGIG